jgi:hypothetical protein
MELAQIVFARWVSAGTRIALAMLVAGYAAYVTGLLEAHVRPEALAALWHLPLADYLAASSAPTGWSWLALAHRGDYLNYLGIGLLCTIVMLAYLRVLPLLVRSARAHALIAVLELVVLLAAASGLLHSI